MEHRASRAWKPAERSPTRALLLTPSEGRGDTPQPTTHVKGEADWSDPRTDVSTPAHVSRETPHWARHIVHDSSPVSVRLQRSAQVQAECGSRSDASNHRFPGPLPNTTGVQPQRDRRAIRVRVGSPRSERAQRVRSDSSSSLPPPGKGRGEVSTAVMWMPRSSRRGARLDNLSVLPPGCALDFLSGRRDPGGRQSPDSRNAQTPSVHRSAASHGGDVTTHSVSRER